MNATGHSADEIHWAAGGRIGETIADSVPAWSQKSRPASDAPNIVVVVLDDMGWSDFGCFGSEIATPTIDSLAAGGVRMTNFQVTPLCSPTRASLLTGKNHHSIGMRFLSITDTGFPNSRGELPADVTTIPEVLRDRGYGTYLSGKWHLVPRDELTPVGPYQNWPLERGFDRFYGFLSGASDQYAPELFQDNSPVASSTNPDYHLSNDLVDHSIGYLSDHLAFRPNDPFYLQLAFGATHAPFQAPREFIDRYRGAFDAGWDQARQDRLERQKSLGVVPQDTVLTERDATVPQWSDLTDDERLLAIRGQEAFAGFLEHTDTQLERLIEWLRNAELLDNTLIAVFADNGAAGDGGELGTTNVIAAYNNRSIDLADEIAGVAEIGDRNNPAHYATGWAMAGNTPFRLFKQYVDLGGVRSPLIVQWPKRIKDAGQVRDQYLHVVDLAATFIDSALDQTDAARTETLDQLDGLSFLDVLSESSTPSPRQTQYYEMIGHRAIWHQGWKATTRHVSGSDYSNDVWRLYDTLSDFSESTDLAATHPERLEDLIQLWWREARAAGALPMDDRTLGDLLGGGKSGAPRQSVLTLRPGQSHVGAATRLTGTDRTMAIEARLRGRTGDQDGVILSSGASYGGYVIYILDGRLNFEHNFLGERVRCVSDRSVPIDDSVLSLTLRRTAGRSADVTLFIDGAPTGQVTVPTTSIQLAFYGMDIGKDPGSQVSLAYPDRGEFPLPDGVLSEVAIRFWDDSPDFDLLAHNAEANQ